MIKFLVRYKTELTIFSLVLLVNLFLTSLPLINILSYESSAINGILFSLISGIYRLKIDKKVSFKTHFKFFIILSIIPFIILSISTILCQKCPLDDGIYFYIIIAIPSIIVGISLAQFSNFIFCFVLINLYSEPFSAYSRTWYKVLFRDKVAWNLIICLWFNFEWMSVSFLIIACSLGPWSLFRLIIFIA